MGSVDHVLCFHCTLHCPLQYNGVPLAPFAPSRGLRQGDPLSPSLFLLVADGLSILWKQYERLGRIEGIKVCRRAPSISHLLFADDRLLFFRATKEQASNVRSAIATFERSTGQLLSPNKCSLLVREGSDMPREQQVRS